MQSSRCANNVRYQLGRPKSIMKHLILRSMAALLFVSTGARAASADERSADAVITMPTAFMLSSTSARIPAIAGRARIDHRGAASVQGSLGLAGIAMLTVDTDRDLRVCETCDDGETLRTLRARHAEFKMGAPVNAWFRGQPALAIGVRITTTTASSTQANIRAADAYVVASEVLGPVTVHAGIVTQDIASSRDGGRLQLSTTSRTIRPMLGIEWHPAPYPRTTLLADLTWVPELRATGPTQTWLGGWGVRYQAARILGVELSVRHRQDEGLADTTVLVGARFILVDER